jgi:hypothetical protein
LAPVAIALTPVEPVTATGILELVTVLFPNWPDPFAPQHFTVPAESSAHEWLVPVAIALTPVKPVTATGILELVTVLLPSWPDPFAPQHFTVPAVSSAHEWLPPAAILGAAAASAPTSAAPRPPPAAAAGSALATDPATIAITNTIGLNERKRFRASPVVFRFPSMKSPNLLLIGVDERSPGRGRYG